MSPIPEMILLALSAAPGGARLADTPVGLVITASTCRGSTFEASPLPGVQADGDRMAGLFRDRLGALVWRWTRTGAGPETLDRWVRMGRAPVPFSVVAGGARSGTRLYVFVASHGVVEGEVSLCLGDQLMPLREVVAKFEAGWPGPIVVFVDACLAGQMALATRFEPRVAVMAAGYWDAEEDRRGGFFTSALDRVLQGRSGLPDPDLDCSGTLSAAELALYVDTEVGDAHPGARQRVVLSAFAAGSTVADVRHPPPACEVRRRMSGLGAGSAPARQSPLEGSWWPRLVNARATESAAAWVRHLLVYVDTDGEVPRGCAPLAASPAQDLVAAGRNLGLEVVHARSGPEQVAMVLGRLEHTGGDRSVFLVTREAGVGRLWTSVVDASRGTVISTGSAECGPPAEFRCLGRRLPNAVDWYECLLRRVPSTGVIEDMRDGAGGTAELHLRPGATQALPGSGTVVEIVRPGDPKPVARATVGEDGWARVCLSRSVVSRPPVRGDRYRSLFQLRGGETCY